MFPMLDLLNPNLGVERAGLAGEKRISQGLQEIVNSSWLSLTTLLYRLKLSKKKAFIGYLVSMSSEK